MDMIVHTVTASGGGISTSEVSQPSDYKRLLRAKERGDLMRVRHGVYATPEAMLSNMMDVEKIVPGGVVCLIMLGHTIIYQRLFLLPFV